MKCYNKSVKVAGEETVITPSTIRITNKMFECLITNDDVGKTLSINNGEIEFLIPFEPIEKYLK